MQGIDQCRNICTIDVEVIEVIILFQNDSISAKGNCQIVSAAREVSRCNIQTRKLNGIISSSIPDGIYAISSLEDDGIITVIILNEIISGNAVNYIISAAGMNNIIAFITINIACIISIIDGVIAFTTINGILRRSTK